MLLWKALHSDEDAMDKEVAVKIKDTRESMIVMMKKDVDVMKPSAGFKPGSWTQYDMPYADLTEPTQRRQGSDESTVISRASSEGNWIQARVLMRKSYSLGVEADVDSKHFNRDDNAGDDNEETKPDPKEIYNIHLTFTPNISNSAEQFSFEMGIRQNPIPNVAQDPVIPTGPSVSIAIDLDAPSGRTDHEPFVNVFAPDYNSELSTAGEINNMNQPVHSTS
ncbi:hypothetical protein Tco_0024549 [Tanacetum coccineum]